MSVDAAVRRVQRAVVFIETQLFNPLTAPQVSAAAGCSEGELHRLFRTVCGSSMMAYRRGRRLTEAARMVDEGRDLLEVAQRCGYTSQASFTRAFTRHFGLPPGAYRRSGPHTLGWVDMPELEVLAHRRSLPEPRLQWVHRPRVLRGAVGSLDMRSDDGVIELASKLDVPDDTALFGVLLSEVGCSMPYFLGVESEGGAESLTLKPGLYAVFRHHGPKRMVRHTITHAVQSMRSDLLRPAQRPSWETFRKGGLRQPELTVELWLAVESGG